MSSSLKRIGSKLMWHIKAFETPVFQRLKLAQRALIKSTKAKRLQSFFIPKHSTIAYENIDRWLVGKRENAIWCSNNMVRAS